MLRTLPTVRVGLSVAVSTSRAHAMRRVALVQDFRVVGRILARGAADGRIRLVLRHVDGAGILQHAAQRRVRRGVGTAGVHRDGDVLGDPGELLGHAVPAGEHRVLSDFEYASHARMVAIRGQTARLAAPSSRHSHECSPGGLDSQHRELP